MRRVGVEEALAMGEEGWTLVDVRSPSERAVSVLRGAVASPPVGGKGERAVFVCRTGVRAAKACERFVEVRTRMSLPFSRIVEGEEIKRQKHRGAPPGVNDFSFSTVLSLVARLLSLTCRCRLLRRRRVGKVSCWRGV